MAVGRDGVSRALTRARRWACRLAACGVGGDGRRMCVEGYCNFGRVGMGGRVSGGVERARRAVRARDGEESDIVDWRWTAE